MALYDLPNMGTTGFSVSRMIDTTISRIRAWNETRSTVRALNALSDRELDDIGLRREDIDGLSGR